MKTHWPPSSPAAGGMLYTKSAPTRGMTSLNCCRAMAKSSLPVCVSPVALTKSSSVTANKSE